MATILDSIRSLGAELSQGVFKIAKVFADNLTIGTEEKPSGITLFDQKTNQPYCFFMYDGAASTTPGACPDITPENNSQTAGAAGSEGGTGGADENGAPVIEVSGSNPTTISVGDTYSDLGAIITGPTQNDTGLGIHTFVGGVEVSPMSGVQIDTSAAGEYTIEYVATNSVGSATSTRTVIVEAPAEVTPPPADEPPAVESPADEPPAVEPPADEPTPQL